MSAIDGLLHGPQVVVVVLVVVLQGASRHSQGAVPSVPGDAPKLPQPAPSDTWLQLLVSACHSHIALSASGAVQGAHVVVVVVLVVVVGSGTHGVSAVSQAECPAEAGG